MSLEHVLAVWLAASAGAVLGWWPLAAWARGSLVGATATTPVTRRAVRLVAAVTTAVVWGVIVWRIGVAPPLPALLAFAAAATVLAIVDLVEGRLPNRVVGPALVVVAALLAVASAWSGDWRGLLGAAVGGAAMFAAYLIVALASPAAMGMGDVKFAGLIGMLLGWFGVEAWVLGVIAASVLGGLIAIGALALGHVTLRDSLPFGPSMLCGALLAVLLVVEVG